MKSLRNFFGYLIVWVCLWLCLTWLWNLPFDLPVKIVKQVGTGIGKIMTPEQQKEEYNPLIDNLYKELEDYNSSVNKRNQNPNYPLYSSNSGVSLIDPYGRQVDPNKYSTDPYHITDPTKSINSPQYPGSISIPSGASKSGSGFQGVTGTTRSSSFDTAYGKW
jgi:hypothetical protein